MSSGGYSFNYFSENELNKLAHLVQFKRVEIGGAWLPPLPSPRWGLGPSP